MSFTSRSPDLQFDELGEPAELIAQPIVREVSSSDLLVVPSAIFCDRWARPFNRVAGTRLGFPSIAIGIITRPEDCVELTGNRGIIASIGNLATLCFVWREVRRQIQKEA
jgi:hypothetical protein